jgi:hypothetical protein
VQSHTEVGVALRSARIALALPLESIARELQLPVAQLRALETGSTESFSSQKQRADTALQLLIRFNLPESWASFEPAEWEWPTPSSNPLVAPLSGTTTGRPAPSAEIPPLISPKPVTSRQRYIALGAASIIVATAIGAALIPATLPVDENELEDLRSSAPSTALKASKAGETKVPDPAVDSRPDTQQDEQTVKEAMPEVLAKPATPSDQPRPTVNAGPYAILPGSQTSVPDEATLEIKARAAVAVDLVLGQGATQLTLRPGDRVVLMSGRAERIEVSDRNAVELAMAGRAVQLAPVAPPAAGNNVDQNPNRGVWTIAGR